jgi:hypothetical protein
MEKTDIDDLLQDITCPGCRQKFTESFGRLKHNPDLICPRCGALLGIDAEQLALNIPRGFKLLKEGADGIRISLRKPL